MKFLGNEVSVNKNIFDCLIAGSGAAAYNAAIHLYDRGCGNLAILTEGRLSGTSRNTGSDKQTYYKIACSGNQKDSPRAMAETLFSGASMDGDLALCEAAHSLEEFFHLVALGVDFPHNRYGEFTGYKTDHDPLQRASSIGPYTSRVMTEKLEESASARGIKLFDKTRAIKILVDKKAGRVYGLLCLKNEKDFCLYFCKNVIFATGGPPGLYSSTVYPETQFGSSGILAREGVVFSNITEWQYGIGSIKFRWNLSGSYQQAIPRYVSIDGKGVENEFLVPYFSGAEKLGRAVFLKGYQWPFDPAKIGGEGSSTVDIAVYIERYLKGRRVYLDFSRNGKGFALDEIDKTAGEYLEKSGALCASPIERLLRLNPGSYQLYKNNGIDLANEFLEIDVLPQHHNGGAEVNIWWETSVKHLFAVGECAGTHGVYRPGGSALNSGQVGGLRAASFIAGRYLKDDIFYGAEFIEGIAAAAIGDFEMECCSAARGEDADSVSPEAAAPDNKDEMPNTAAARLLKELQRLNTRAASFIRSRKELEKAAEALEILAEKKRLSKKTGNDLTAFFRLDEMLILSKLLHEGILGFIRGGGKSRGSCLVVDSLEDIEACLGGVEIDTLHRDKVINTAYIPGEGGAAFSARPVRPIPETDSWFENVWREYREGAIFAG